MNESEATFIPTCFIHTNDLSPEAAAAAATSRATFSFVKRQKYIPASLATSIKTSPISEEGVPGYVAATEMPFSRAPRTTASFPSKYNLVPGFAVSMSLIFLVPPCQLCLICMDTSSGRTAIISSLVFHPRSSVTTNNRNHDSGSESVRLNLAIWAREAQVSLPWAFRRTSSRSHCKRLCFYRKRRVASSVVSSSNGYSTHILHISEPTRL